MKTPRPSLLKTCKNFLLQGWLMVPYGLGGVFLFGYVTCFTRATLALQLADMCIGMRGILIFPPSSHWIRRTCLKGLGDKAYLTLKTVNLLVVFLCMGFFAISK
ncbi:MAG: hypothetical protein ACKO37_03750 [Vampirovibrionales bacterium]